MTLIVHVFPKLRIAKDVVSRMSKKPHFRTPFDSQHVKGTAWKVSKWGVISGSYFPAFVLNTERHEVSLRIQSECGKIQTRKESVFRHFSHRQELKHYWN